MTAEELRGRMQHDVRAILDRPAQVGRHRGGIHHQRHPSGVGDLGKAADVGNVSRRVGYYFGENGFGVLPDGRGVVARVVAGHECGVHPEPAQRDVELGNGAPIQSRRGHDVVARPCQRSEGTELCGLPAAGGHCTQAALQGGNALLQCCHCGVADAGVDVAVLLQGEQRGGVGGVIEDEAGGLVDRHRTSAGGGVGLPTSVQCAGAEAPLTVGHGLPRVRRVMWSSRAGWSSWVLGAPGRFSTTPI